MKTTLLLFFLLFICSQLHAQNVNIPDPVFKQRLIDEGVDTNSDGEIQVSEAEAVTGLLDVNGQFDDISDLTGIEAFVNITELYCQLNALTSIDLSQNTSLVVLECWENPLTSLNITQCTELEFLEAEHTQLTTIDLSNNISLITLTFRDSNLNSLNLTNNSNLQSINCSVNKLTALDIRNGSNTNLNYFNAGVNPGLTCIFVDDADYSNNNPNWYKDGTSTYVETQAECDAMGINDNEALKIQIYPNPVKNLLYINSNSKMGIVNADLRLINVIGKTVYQTKLNTEKNIIDLSSLQKGIYFLTVGNNKKLLTKKIIKL